MNEEWSIERIRQLLGERDNWPQLSVDDGEADLYLDGEQSRYSLIDEKGFTYAWIPGERLAHLAAAAPAALAWCVDAIETQRKLAAAAHGREDHVLDLLSSYGQTQGAHHKAWVIDQIARTLLGEQYDKWIAAMDDAGCSTWDTGIVP